MKSETIIGLFIVFIVLTLVAATSYSVRGQQLLMDEFCELHGGKMSEYKRDLGASYIKFKCDSRGDTVFTLNLYEVETDEWGDTTFIEKRPEKSIIKNLFR